MTYHNIKSSSHEQGRLTLTKNIITKNCEAIAAVSIETNPSSRETRWNGKYLGEITPQMVLSSIGLFGISAQLTQRPRPRAQKQQLPTTSRGSGVTRDPSTIGHEIPLYLCSI